MNSKQKRAFLFFLHFESASNESSLKNKQTNKTPNAQNRPFQKEGPPDLISQQVLRQLWPQEKQNTQGRCLAPASPDWHQSPWIGKKKDKWVTSHLVVTYSIGPRYQRGNDSQVAELSAAQSESSVDPAQSHTGLHVTPPETPSVAAAPWHAAASCLIGELRIESLTLEMGRLISPWLRYLSSWEIKRKQETTSMLSVASVCLFLLKSRTKSFNCLPRQCSLPRLIIERKPFRWFLWFSPCMEVLKLYPLPWGLPGPLQHRLLHDFYRTGGFLSFMPPFNPSVHIFLLENQVSYLRTHSPTELHTPQPLQNNVLTLVWVYPGHRERMG